MDLTVSINSTATHHEMTHSKICSRVTEDSQREESWLMMEKKKKKKKKKLSKDFSGAFFHVKLTFLFCQLVVLFSM